MIQTAKQNIDLHSLVESAGVELRQHGNRHVGLCPFHTERTPSFYVFDDHHCADIKYYVFDNHHYDRYYVSNN